MPRYTLGFATACASRLRYTWARMLGRKGPTPRRYRNLLRGIARTKARSILEIGVYQGTRSREMIEMASAFRPAQEIEYFGFDLFEELTSDVLKAELSKKPQTEEQIRTKLASTGATVRLFKGYSQETLPAFVEECKKSGRTIDFAFIDGGHFAETIASDWNNVRQLMGPQSVVMFDDYFSNTEQALQQFGCQSLIDTLDTNEFDVRVLPPEERFMQDSGTILRIRIACVSLKS